MSETGSSRGDQFGDLPSGELVISDSRDESSVVLRVDAGLTLIAGDERFELPMESLTAVFARFGAEAAADEGREVGSLDLGGGATLRRVRHRTWFDVEARDYLILQLPDDAPRFVIAPTVSAALLHLGRRLPAT